MMIGLGAFTAVFAGAVVIASQAGSSSDSGYRDAETGQVPNRAAITELPAAVGP